MGRYRGRASGARSRHDAVARCGRPRARADTGRSGRHRDGAQPARRGRPRRVGDDRTDGPESLLCHHGLHVVRTERGSRHHRHRRDCRSLDHNQHLGGREERRHQARRDGPGVRGLATGHRAPRAPAANLPLRDGLRPLRARHHLEDHGSGGTDRPSERCRVQAVLLVSACRYAPSPRRDAPLYHHHAPNRASHPETDRTAYLRMAPTGSGMNSVIEVASLRKSFKGRDGTSRAVLKDLDLAVGAGEFLCILGPSGCGKSTLLNVLAGLDKAYEGRACVSLRPLALLLQEPRLLPWLTADGNLDFALASCRVPTSRWSELKSRYLAMTGLSEYRDYYPHQISGGMAQRLALVRALCVEPGILLMDEPFSGLDEITARRIRSDLLSIWEETRKTIVFVTHSAYEACFLADRILVMSGGAFRQEMRVPIARPRSYDDLAIFEFSPDVIKAFGDGICREPVPPLTPLPYPTFAPPLHRHLSARMNI